MIIGLVVTTVTCVAGTVFVIDAALLMIIGVVVVAFDCSVAFVEDPELLNAGRILSIDPGFVRKTATATIAIMMTIIIPRVMTSFFLLRGFAGGIDLGTSGDGERSFGVKSRGMTFFCGCAASGAASG